MQTRNFTLNEVFHRPQDVMGFDVPKIGLIAQGYIQGLRDSLTEAIGRDCPIIITSGYRSLAFNRSIKSKDSSYHVWRIENGKALFALDFTSPVLTPDNLFELVRKRVVGETYLHKKLGFVHIAPCGPDEEWKQ